MLQLSSKDVLFVGKGNQPVAWYRTGSPSFALGCDWVGIQGSPKNYEMRASIGRMGIEAPSLDDYKIVILQQVKGQQWINEIARLKKKGIKVFYEIDDYIRGVAKTPGHQAAEIYTKKHVKEHEICMRVADGLIVSTPFLAKKFRSLNKNIWICRNGIEKQRYENVVLPKRDQITIGWAGGIGHLSSVAPWLPAIETILDRYENVRFVTVGHPFAGDIDRRFADRCLSLPYVSIENYPTALANIDIGLAPAGRGSFFQGKSDLRWLEYGALGIPCVADPFVYSDTRDHVDAVRAETAAGVENALKWLLDEPERRQEISENVRERILTERSIEQTCEDWERAFVEVFA